MNKQTTTRREPDEDLFTVFQAHEKPVPVELDQAILAAAREPVEASPPQAGNRPGITPWFGIAATLLIGIAITPLLLRSPESAIEVSSTSYAPADSAAIAELDELSPVAQQQAPAAESLAEPPAALSRNSNSNTQPSASMAPQSAAIRMEISASHKRGSMQNESVEGPEIWQLPEASDLDAPTHLFENGLQADLDARSTQSVNVESAKLARTPKAKNQNADSIDTTTTVDSEATAADTGGNAGDEPGTYRETPATWLKKIQDLLKADERIQAEKEFRLFRKEFPLYQPEFKLPIR